LLSCFRAGLSWVPAASDRLWYRLAFGEIAEHDDDDRPPTPTPPFS
jgi:hypothetical protein